jgi:REP element-mobilizing transposase RayT
MPTPRVPRDLNAGTYFLTFTIRKWYYILDRYNRWDILAESLEYCKKNKSLKLYSFVFMINHIHIIINSPDVAGFIRDFKKHTSREIVKNIKYHEPNVFNLFETGNGKYELWDRTNMPKHVETERYFQQKVSYIH